MTAFYLSTECENCDEEILYGPCLTTIEHRTIRGTAPVVPISMVEQVEFRCETCGAENYTGDLDLYCEGGEKQDGDEDEDES